MEPTIRSSEAPRLGDKVQEVVTEHVGVVAGLVEYLWGCHQALVHYRDEADGGKVRSEWWDLGRLRVLERDAVAPIAYASFVYADGTEELTPAPAFRGADLAPPTR